MERQQEGRDVVKGKLWALDEDFLLEVVEAIRRLYRRDIKTSRLLSSAQGGSHVYLTIYREGQ